MSYASDARKTPEQREAEKEQKEKLRREAEANSQAIRRAFATSDGRRCLKQIMDRCKYQSPITAVTDGKIAEENLIHNAALQGLYLWLRKHVDDETLIDVEVRGIKSDLDLEEKEK